MWSVEFTDEFGLWWDELDESEQDAIDVHVGLLERIGPALKAPTSKPVLSSRHAPDMKELRVTGDRGSRLRILYAFDPRRTAILLIGGDKKGRWREFYEEFVPIADRLYDQHLDEISDRGKQ